MANHSRKTPLQTEFQSLNSDLRVIQVCPIEITELRGNKEAKCKTLLELFAGYGKQVLPDTTPLQDMPFNVRCQNCLRQAGLKTLIGLNNISTEKLMMIPTFGRGTLKQLLDIYTLTFLRSSSSSQISFDFSRGERFLDASAADLFPTEPTFEQITGRNFSSINRSLSVERLRLSVRSRNILRSNSIEIIGQLLILLPSDIIKLAKAGSKTAADIELALREFDVLSHEQQKAAPKAEDQAQSVTSVRGSLSVEDVAWNIFQWCSEIDLNAYGIHLPENFFPCQRFNSYGELLLAVLDQSIKQPRRRDIFIEYYGLFSTPLSRTELIKKYGVSPSRIYQMLSLSERTLSRFRSLISAFALPCAHLLYQHKGVLSASDLERDLVEQFHAKTGSIRGAGLLELLSEYPDIVETMTIIGRGEQVLALAPPVTLTNLMVLVSKFYEQLIVSNNGLGEAEVEQTIKNIWAEVIPDCPVPVVGMRDLVWLNPKIVMKEGLWQIRTRSLKPRVTDRFTLTRMMETILTKNGRPMLVQDLFASCREQFGELNIPACRTATQRNPHVFRSYGRGVQGLACWGDFIESDIEAVRMESRRNTPRTLIDKIESVLEEAGLPMQFQDLLRAIQDRFEECDERSVRQALLLCPGRFQGYGNGIYGLTMWKEDAFIYMEEAVVGFLERRGYPASETEICDGLKDQFLVSVPICRWILRRIWKQSGVIAPLEGALWEIADGYPAEVRRSDISVDDLLLEQLLSC